MADDVVYVSIGNTDNKLTQQSWSEFVMRVRGQVEASGTILGEWFSLPDAPWQNACWCVGLDDDSRLPFRDALRFLAGRYKQDAISWVEGPTEMLGPPDE